MWPNRSQVNVECSEGCAYGFWPPAKMRTNPSVIPAEAGIQNCSPSENYRGRDGALASPLPPNRTGGSPASGSPVGGLTHYGIDSDTRAAFRLNNPRSEKYEFGQLR